MNCQRNLGQSQSVVCKGLLVSNVHYKPGAHLTHFCHTYCQNSSKGKEMGRTVSAEMWLLKLLNIPAAGKVFFFSCIQLGWCRYCCIQKS